MRVKFDESLKISGPYGDMDAKFQPCQDDEAPNNLLIMAHGFRGSMEGRRQGGVSFANGVAVCERSAF
mgnify:CR=1 FL=1